MIDKLDFQLPNLFNNEKVKSSNEKQHNQVQKLDFPLMKQLNLQTEPHNQVKKIDYPLIRKFLFVFSYDSARESI